MSNIDEKIEKIVTSNLELPPKYNFMLKNIFNKLPQKENLKHHKLKLTLATTFCSMILVTGIVFAKDIGNFIKQQIPENMYNRTDNAYEILSCENENFNIYETKLTDTEFRIGIEISNIENYKEEQKKLDEYTSKLDNTLSEYTSEYLKLYENYMIKRFPIGDSITLALPNLWEQHEKYECYLKTETGEKYRLKEEVGYRDPFEKAQKYNYVGTSELTKYTATDNLEVIIAVYGTPYKIELKHIK